MMIDGTRDDSEIQLQRRQQARQIMEIIGIEPDFAEELSKTMIMPSAGPEIRVVQAVVRCLLSDN